MSDLDLCSTAGLSSVIKALLFFLSYEIQLESNARGKGLGKFLMQILEMMAHRLVTG